jgi:hypothetical protein
MPNDDPLTRADLDQLKDWLRRELAQNASEQRVFVLDRETALLWKVIALQVTLIGVIAGAQWAAFAFILTHWKP